MKQVGGTVLLAHFTEETCRSYQYDLAGERAQERDDPRPRGDTRELRVLRLYRRLNTLSSLDFLGQVRRALSFAIRKIQTDHGTEFSFGFVLAIERAGIRHRYIQPRRPEQNGKVEKPPH